MSASFLAATTRDGDHLELLNKLGFTSYMCVPLLAGDRALGALTLVSAGSGRRFGRGDLAIAEELAGHAAAVIDQARRHDREREAARSLQDALLPAELPGTEHLEMAAAYLPASDAAMGGDWYDVFPVDGGTCIVIGDVAGHGLHAVAVMAQVRNALRAFADEDPSPARIMTRLNRMLCRLEPNETATAIVAVWNPDARTLMRANAGHPPILRCRTGEFSYLPEEARGPLLGADPTVCYFETSKLLRPGTTLVLYTDGLVETRDRSLDDNMSDLLAFVEELSDHSPRAVRDDILSWRGRAGRLSDDLCILAARLA
jgi:serine phosphatase RsbU (regulator of sigma subunit)